jgi:hypothetical protein
MKSLYWTLSIVLNIFKSYVSEAVSAPIIRCQRGNYLIQLDAFLDVVMKHIQLPKRRIF